MQKISKPVSFYRRNYLYLMGAFWLLAGFVILIFDDKDWLGLGYAGFGIASSVYGIIKRKNTEEYIAWNSDRIEIGQMYNEPQVYNREQIDLIHFSENNLTIKSGVAGVTMLELKDYRAQDLERLRKELNSYFN